MGWTFWKMLKFWKLRAAANLIAIMDIISLLTKCLFDSLAILFLKILGLTVAQILRETFAAIRVEERDTVA